MCRFVKTLCIHLADTTDASASETVVIISPAVIVSPAVVVAAPESVVVISPSVIVSPSVVVAAPITVVIISPTVVVAAPESIVVVVTEKSKKEFEPFERRQLLFIFTKRSIFDVT